MPVTVVIAGKYWEANARVGWSSDKPIEVSIFITPNKPRDVKWILSRSLLIRGALGCQDDPDTSVPVGDVIVGLTYGSEDGSGGCKPPDTIEIIVNSHDGSLPASLLFWRDTFGDFLGDTAEIMPVCNHDLSEFQTSCDDESCRECSEVRRLVDESIDSLTKPQ